MYQQQQAGAPIYETGGRAQKGEGKVHADSAHTRVMLTTGQKTPVGGRLQPGRARSGEKEQVEIEGR